jgi:hypothetical protein
MTHFGDRSIAVIGHSFHQDAYAVRAVAFIENFFQRATRQFTCAPLYRPLNVVLRHVGRFCLVDGQPEAYI